MRRLLLLGWLTLPVIGVAWHYGPGQDWLRVDDADAILVRAQAQLADKDWAAARATLDEALSKLPTERVAAIRRVRLERARAQMFLKELPEAQRALSALVDELEADPAADRALERDARESLANAQFYMTWLMRLEGQPREMWEPEVEAARQNYRLLAERAQAGRDAAKAQRSKEDLETAIRLARLELKDLQGLPLPSQ